MQRVLLLLQHALATTTFVSPTSLFICLLVVPSPLSVLSTTNNKLIDDPDTHHAIRRSWGYDFVSQKTTRTDYYYYSCLFVPIFLQNGNPGDEG